MSRPPCPRKISFAPPVTYFKPAGIPMRELAEVRLAADEMEALRLADYEGMYNMDAARAMGVSRQTFDRIVGRARQKVAEALVLGRSLRIETLQPRAVPKAPAARTGNRPRGQAG